MWHRIQPRALTVKLRGRLRRQAALWSNEADRTPPKRPAGRRGRTLSPSARGAKQEAPHGPLQRLLGGMLGNGVASLSTGHRNARNGHIAVAAEVRKFR